MDTTRLIQIAVARTDLAVTQARDSPWLLITAVALIALAVLLSIIWRD